MLFRMTISCTDSNIASTFLLSVAVVTCVSDMVSVCVNIHVYNEIFTYKRFEADFGKNSRKRAECMLNSPRIQIW